MNCQRSIFLAATAALLSAAATAQTRRFENDAHAVVTGFGTAIVMDGNEVYVGRPGEMSMFPMPASRAGGVHIFEIGDGGQWTEVGSVGLPDGVPGDAFGTSLAMNGDLMVVGAPKHNGGRGAVHLFTRSNGSWAYAATYANDDGTPTDGLGLALAIAGDVILAGMPGWEDGKGAVLALQRSTAGLVQLGVLTATSGEPNDRFGSSLAVDGGRVVVGAPGPAGISILGLAGTPKPGTAFLFVRGAGPAGFEQQAVLRSESPGVTALGHAVGFVGEAVALTAPLTAGGAGAIHLFQQDESGSWAQTSVLNAEPAAPGSLFGFALATLNETMLVGAPLPSGAVYAFQKDATGEWTQRQRLSSSLTGMTVFQGGAIAVAGNRAVVGAPGADFFQGAGVLFERDGAGNWNERSKLVDDLPGFDAVAGGQVDCEEGSAAVFNCEEVDLVAFIPVKDLGAERGITVNDVWGWTDSLTGKDYAIVGRSDGTTFIDVSVPENPQYLGVLPLTEGATVNIWRDIKVYNNHAFIVADAAGPHGVQIFDLTQLRNVANAPVTFTETARYSGIFSAHNIVINERTGFAYAVGSSGGGETCGGALHMIDVRTPAEPKFAGCFSDPTTGNASTGYSHDAQCITYHGPDVDYAGREICFGSNETALSIADVTDKANPTAISSGSYPSVAYAHQGWVTDDHRHFFMNDELDELTGAAPRTRTLVWDIEDLDDPVLLMEYLGTTQASDHNLYIRGDYMYQSNYVSGLRIVDISDPGNPTEVGHFDTVPFGEDAPGFAGSWSNFPFFDSGMIVVTSMWEGVFILKKRDTRPIP